MSYRVELTRLAKSDVRGIVAWYRDKSGSQSVADKWVDGFLKLVKELGVSPDRHPSVNVAESVTGDVREIHYGSGRRRTHRIIFEIVDTEVYVLRVRHFAQDDLTPDELRDDPT